MTRLDAPTEPKPEGRKRKYREGVVWGVRHMWVKAWDGWEQKCNGLGVNVAQPDWEGEGEECPRCYGREDDLDNVTLHPEDEDAQLQREIAYMVAVGHDYNCLGCGRDVRDRDTPKPPHLAGIGEKSLCHECYTKEAHNAPQTE